jgi:predicted SprT family Zn-dependent metalloprotease
MKKSEDPKKFFDLLEKSIIEVSDSNNVINKTNLRLGEYKNKYSNLSTPTITLFSGDTPLNRNSYTIKYMCLCGNISTILLKKFLIKNSLVCSKCRETEEKRKKHSELLKNPNFKKKVVIPVKTDLTSLINKSVLEFELESSEFIDNYFRKNVSEVEYNQIKSKIVKINGIEIIGKDVKFIPILRVNNQSKYSQYVLIDDKKTHLSNIQYRCDNCENNFNTTRRPKEKLKNYKILCPSCSFCNKTFKIKKYTTKFDDIITYQSNFEKDFIGRCELLNIRILDGDTVNYRFKNINHKYRIDFLLPDYKFLIELKANHIWHRKQLQSGVWKIKQSEAENYSSRNGLTYKLLFQEDIENFFTSIKI